MKKTIEERMIIAEGRLEAIKRVNELIQQCKDYDFCVVDDGRELAEWQEHANAVAQAKLDAYLDMINYLLD